MSRAPARVAEGKMANVRAQLSPNEATTLRRIAGGAANLEELRAGDVKRLIALGLAQRIDGKLVASRAGVDRLGLKTFTTRQEQQGRRRRLKVRRLPF